MIVSAAVMDSTPAQSTSKCVGSDFSIERILSQESRSVIDRTETSDWLYCTRYRPPRLPRSENGSGCRTRRSGRHARVPFTSAQSAALEAAYSRSPYLAPPALRALAAALHLRDDRIKIWFQNRRARERREKSANIAPPFAVTLPPSVPTYRSLISSNVSWVAHRRFEESTNDRLPRFTRNSGTDNLIVCDEMESNDVTMASLVYPETSFSDAERPETPLDIESIE